MITHVTANKRLGTIVITNVLMKERRHQVMRWCLCGTGPGKMREDKRGI